MESCTFDVYGRLLWMFGLYKSQHDMAVWSVFSLKYLELYRGNSMRKIKEQNQFECNWYYSFCLHCIIVSVDSRRFMSAHKLFARRKTHPEAKDLFWWQKIDLSASTTCAWDRLRPWDFQALRSLIPLAPWCPQTADWWPMVRDNYGLWAKNGPENKSSSYVT